MHDHKFNPEFLHKLNNQDRLKDLPPDILFSQFKSLKPEIILDIGAGTGFFSVQLAKYFPSAKVFACDIAHEMIDWMNENICNGHDQISTYLMTENHIPFDDNIADILIMVNLHHELDDPDMMLKECKRVIKPGGHILIVDWKKEEMPMGPPVEIRCKPEDVEKQLRNAGFINMAIITQLKKHFVVVGDKKS